MPPARPLSITEESRDRELRLKVGGELDIGTAGELLERVNGCALDPDMTLALDMAGVTFMDVSGMRVLLEAAQRCHSSQSRFVIYNPRRIATRVFSLTAVDQQLEIRFDEPAGDASADDASATAGPAGATPAEPAAEPTTQPAGAQPASDPAFRGPGGGTPSDASPSA